MQPKRLSQAVMFADVSGSSRLYKEQGNTQAKQSIDTTLEGTRAIITQHQGTVVKTLGDEIMARFDEPHQACQAAVDLQRRAEGELALRIGMSCGELLMDEHGDVFGDVVNDAAAVSHIARARQIVITDVMRDLLPGFLAHQCEAFDRVTLKGANHPRLVYRLCWETPTQPHNATAVMEVAELHQRLQAHRLYIEGAQRSQELGPEDLPLTFGRDAEAVHWAIDSNKVSREHCEIVFRRGKFVLIDHSTNGTYVTVSQDEALYIRREEAPLTGSGTLCLGQKPGRPDTVTLSFTVKST